MENMDIKLRRRITFILRHSKNVVNSSGWISIYRLAKILGKPIKVIKMLVKSDIERYEYSSKFNKVRAKTGHTNGVKIECTIKRPPEVLYYGIKMSELKDTLENGSDRMVHLLGTRKLARNGIEKGSSVVLIVMSGKMYRDGFKFSKSIYDEWYVNSLPAKYIRLVA